MSLVNNVLTALELPRSCIWKLDSEQFHSENILCVPIMLSTRLQSPVGDGPIQCQNPSGN